MVAVWDKDTDAAARDRARPGGMCQYRSGDGDAGPLRLQLGGRRVVEEPDAHEPREAALRRPPPVLPGRRPDRQRVHDAGLILGYTDRPTITYAPLVGERFARSLMTPLPPPAILSLIQAGYPVDAVLRLTVHEVNGIRNRYGGDLRARPADPEFYAL